LERHVDRSAALGAFDVEVHDDASQWLSLASVMGPPCCHEHGTTWKCYRA
jgi:hypothetical protein